MPCLATLARGTLTPASLVPGPLWPRHQYYLPAFLDPNLVLCILAAEHAGGAEHDELGGCYVWRGDHLEFGLLCGLGEGELCGAGFDCEEGSIEGKGRRRGFEGVWYIVYGESM